MAELLRTTGFARRTGGESRSLKERDSHMAPSGAMWEGAQNINHLCDPDRRTQRWWYNDLNDVKEE